MLRSKFAAKSIYVCISAVVIMASAWRGGVASADQVPVIAPVPGMVEEFTFIGHEYVAAGPIAIGPNDYMWFPEQFSATGVSVIERFAPNAVGEFTSLALTPAPMKALGYRMTALAQGPADDMWFTEGYSTESFIGHITDKGEVSEFVMPGSFSQPLDIGLGSDGAMWFTNAGEGTIGRIDGSGSITQYEVKDEIHTSPLSYTRPVDITRGPNEAMWFSDEAGFIGEINAVGTILEYLIPAPGSAPAGIALGADGNIWFVEDGLGRIGRITPGGVVSEFEAANAYGQIVSGADGNMWFTEGSGENAIGRITPTGVVTSFSPISTKGGGLTQLSVGVDGDLWFRQSNSVGRFVVPLVPVSVGLPVVSGEVVEGGVLSVSGGSWSNGPTAFGYQWQLCDASGGGCVDLGGEVAATHALRVGDVGHTLRVVVRASGPGGSASVVSGASAVVRAAPPRGPARVIESAPPAVRATMTWSFGWARAYTVVESLVVHKLPDGAMVGVVCRGRGCPFAKRHFVTGAVVGGGKSCKGGKCHSLGGRSPRGSLDITGLFKRRRLGVGAHITLAITKKGWTGKSFAFTIRTNKTPSVEITCPEYGSGNHVSQC